MSDWETRFWSKVDKGPAWSDGCWLWGGGVTNRGAGRIQIDGVTKMAARVSWQLHRGSTQGRFVGQTCGDKRCVNPDHLFLRGTGNE
jgi:hypothetical protein